MSSGHSRDANHARASVELGLPLEDDHTAVSNRRRPRRMVPAAKWSRRLSISCVVAIAKMAAELDKLVNALHF